MKYRHELKFTVSDIDLELIRYRLMPLMKADAHQEGRAYTVRSLYFDDYRDSGMKENEDGVDNRKKYRIRIYNGSDSVIKLERKSKHHGMSHKLSVTIPKEDCYAYMQGKTVPVKEDSSVLEKEFFAEMQMHAMRPVSIVEYERTAFVEKRGNVRVTFDRNISGSEKKELFLDKPPLVPLLPAGVHVLEVKYDEFLPEHIAQALEIGRLQQTSFSKYYYARNYKNL